MRLIMFFIFIVIPITSYASKHQDEIDMQKCTGALNYYRQLYEKEKNYEKVTVAEISLGLIYDDLLSKYGVSHSELKEKYTKIGDKDNLHLCTYFINKSSDALRLRLILPEYNVKNVKKDLIKCTALYGFISDKLKYRSQKMHEYYLQLTMISAESVGSIYGGNIKEFKSEVASEYKEILQTDPSDRDRKIKHLTGMCSYYGIGSIEMGDVSGITR
ncbi:hypothetical protein [Desulfovibrio sp. X2]|uniref:hypothetical protein n=1 Tax=Desulfovibrio sp. X2 TaxID=941449 RepID=UPI00126821DC|nr:hypothetical protein [Desulfovibrio sp. X2]